MKHRSKRGGSKRPLVIITLIILIGIVLLVGQMTGVLRLGMREVKSFKADGVCTDTSTSPACGFCPGDVSDGRCFVRYGELSEYK